MVMGGNCLEQSQSACTTSINRLLSGICCTTNILKHKMHTKLPTEKCETTCFSNIVYTEKKTFHDDDFGTNYSSILRSMKDIPRSSPCRPHGGDPSQSIFISLTHSHTHLPAFYVFFPPQFPSLNLPHFCFFHLRRLITSTHPVTHSLSLSVFKCSSAFA